MFTIYSVFFVVYTCDVITFIKYCIPPFSFILPFSSCFSSFLNFHIFFSISCLLLPSSFPYLFSVPLFSQAFESSLPAAPPRWLINFLMPIISALQVSNTPVLRYVVLYCVVLCCVVLCCAVLCCVVLGCIVLFPSLLIDITSSIFYSLSLNFLIPPITSSTTFTLCKAGSYDILRGGAPVRTVTPDVHHAENR